MNPLLSPEAVDLGNLEPKRVNVGASVIEISPGDVSSPALQRLIAEVRNDSTGCDEKTYAYDRVHNKHNR
jgi:hypothetical protein